MRTKRIKIYSYNELSLDAKQKAVREYIQAVRQNEHYRVAENYAQEVLIANEYEFLQDGTLYTG